MLEAALSQIHHGWSVIPWPPRGKRLYLPLLSVNDSRPTWQPYQD